MNADGSGQQLMIDAGVNSSDYIASGWSPDGWNVLYTYINYINYNGTWYWTEAIMRAVAVSGFFNSVTLNPMREMDWRPDWQTLDVYAPTVGINPLASVSTAQFTVSWWGADEQSGLRDYTVQVRDGVGGAWMDWQVNTGATSADFTGLGGHTYYFRVRSRDNHVNVSSWTPDDQVFTTVESEAPVTRLETLPDFLRQLDVTLVWAGYDPGGSGIASYDVQYRDGLNGDWTMLLDDSTATTYDFQGQYGHTYFFRLRGQDAAQNVEAWGPETENPTTTLYAWKISGTTTDNTGLPLEGVDVMIDPHPFLDLSSDEQGQYKAYLSSNPAAKRVSWSRAEYLGLPETDLMGESDVSFDVVMPPGDNLVQNWGFEGGSLAPAWQAGGIFTPVVTADAHHTGQSAVRLGEGYTFGLTETVVPNLEVSYYDGMVQDANGILHIVWRRSDTEYYAQRDLAGNWSVAEEVVSVGSWDSAVHLAVSSDGVVHLVWNDDGLIGYSWRDLDGVWSSPQTLSGDSGGREVVYLDKNNVFHIVWYENDIVYYMQRPAGGDWSAVEQVPAGGYFFSVNFAVGAAGDVYLAWGNGPNLAHRDITGTWSLQRFDFGWGIARVVIDASDRVHLIWTNQVTDYDSGLSQDYLYYAYGDVGDELGEPQILFEGINVEKIDAGVDHNDNLHFILEGTTLNFAYSSVYYIKIDRAGNWTQPVDIEQPAVEPADYIQMAVSENGEVFVLVEQMLQNEYYASVPEVHLLYLSQGRWSEPINISQSRGTSVSSSMAVSDTGMVHIVWAESAKGVIYRGYLPSKGGTSWLSQPITLTQGVNAPVLSFFYQLSGADDQANTGLSVQVSNSLTTTLLYSTTDNVDWTHAWFDLSPWLGQTITLTFQTNTIAGVAPVRLYLDEVTIGSSYPDVWATFAGAQAGLPGDQITLQLAYGNRGGALAENAAITLTLPADLSYVGASQPPAAVGQMLTWEVGDLAAGSGPYTIDVTVEVDANAIPGEWLVSQAVIHAASPELEALNNTAQVRTLVGKLLFLPVISR
ncbi:MAG TPA: hypothetical protein PKM21_18245 [Anaerolineales bacterium]|nr:hypothetical protein [Anaerolineales bacterium]